MCFFQTTRHNWNDSGRCFDITLSILLKQTSCTLEIYEVMTNIFTSNNIEPDKNAGPYKHTVPKKVVTF